MKPVVSGLPVALLLFGCLPAALNTVTLTDAKPSGFFPLPEKVLASAPRILSLTITKVVNPAGTALDIAVYLSFEPASATGRTTGRRERILIGNISLYPPGHPAGFLMPVDEAFGKLEAAAPASHSSNVRLLIEMRRVHARIPWTPVELVVAPPAWREK